MLSHIETTALNDPQITLDTKGHTGTHDSQISIHFALRTDFFELQATLRQWHRTTSKWPHGVNSHMYLKYKFYTPPRIQTFTPLCCTIARFPDNWRFFFCFPRWWVWILKKQEAQGPSWSACSLACRYKFKCHQPCSYQPSSYTVGSLA